MYCIANGSNITIINFNNFSDEINPISDAIHFSEKYFYIFKVQLTECNKHSEEFLDNDFEGLKAFPLKFSLRKENCSID